MERFLLAEHDFLTSPLTAAQIAPGNVPFWNSCGKIGEARKLHIVDRNLPFMGAGTPWSQALCDNPGLEMGTKINLAYLLMLFFAPFHPPHAPLTEKRAGGRGGVSHCH